MSSASAAPVDNARIQGLTTQGRHLSRDEYDEAAKLHAQFRTEVARDPNKLRICQYAFGCFLNADEPEVSQLHAENRAWREDCEARTAAKKEAAREDLKVKVAARNAAKATQLKEEQRQHKEELKKKVADNEARMMQRGARQAADVAPVAPAVSHPDAPASRKNWEPMTYDPEEHRSAVKKSRSRASHSIVKGSSRRRRTNTR